MNFKEFWILFVINALRVSQSGIGDPLLSTINVQLVNVQACSMWTIIHSLFSPGIPSVFGI